MTQPEYPGAVWMGPPRAYGKGRDGYAVMLSVTHHTAGRAGPGTARAGALYDKKRLDGVSCHAFHDSEETVQEVLTRDRANAAFGKGNRIGVQHELCATQRPREWWLEDPIGHATLLRGAAAQAWDCMTYDLEPRRLSVDEVRQAWDRFPNGPRGLCGHYDITRAYRIGDHTDPGAGFPWDVYEREVQAAMGQPAVIAGGADDMIKVLAVNNSGKIDYFALVDTKLIGIPDGPTLEGWRALANGAAEGNITPKGLEWTKAVLDPKALA